MRNFKLLTAGMAFWLLPAFCQNASKLAPDLPASGEDSLDVIVQFNGPLSDVLERKLANLGGKLKVEFEAIWGAAYTLPPFAINILAQDPAVTYISPDRQLTATLDNANPTVGAGTAFQAGLDGT